MPTARPGRELRRETPASRAMAHQACDLDETTCREGIATMEPHETYGRGPTVAAKQRRTLSAPLERNMRLRAREDCPGAKRLRLHRHAIERPEPPRDGQRRTLCAPGQGSRNHQRASKGAPTARPRRSFRRDL